MACVSLGVSDQEEEENEEDDVKESDMGDEEKFNDSDDDDDDASAMRAVCHNNSFQLNFESQISSIFQQMLKSHSQMRY